MRSLTFSKAISTVLVICALTVTALLVKREIPLFKSIFNFAPSPIRQLDTTTWQRVSENDLILGPYVAEVKIIEFYDYECPFCRRLQSTIDEIRQMYPTDVAVIYRHFPLPSHTTAYPAAIAVECANLQGKFEIYHKALFSLQGVSSNLDWIGLAQAIGVTDLDSFRECVEEEIPSEKINTDTRLARSLEIDAIPTLIVDGKLFQGVLSTSELDKIIQQVLQE